MSRSRTEHGQGGKGPDLDTPTASPLVDFFHLGAESTPDEREIRERVRAFCQGENEPH